MGGGGGEGEAAGDVGGGGGGNPSVVVNSGPARTGLINRKKIYKGYANHFFQFPNNTKRKEIQKNTELYFLIEIHLLNLRTDFGFFIYEEDWVRMPKIDMNRKSRSFPSHWSSPLQSFFGSSRTQHSSHRSVV